MASEVVVDDVVVVEVVVVVVVTFSGPLVMVAESEDCRGLELCKVRSVLMLFQQW